MSHTPGPWLAGLEAAAEALWQNNVSQRKRMSLDEQRDLWLLMDAVIKQANAAPDLLEALRQVVAIADRKTDEFDRAHAAIARATS